MFFFVWFWCSFVLDYSFLSFSLDFKYALDGLTKKKRPVCKTERSEQIQMEF
ncbi:CII family transcriptional regulator [Staphylococcus aureus]|uniref:CII family transcriptional regulator n=1 Tax=Staphylococcus aureus TaxID=1280 RepID=UPI003C703CD7